MRKFNSIARALGPCGGAGNASAAGTYSISIVSTSAGANAIPSNNYANEGNQLQININTYNITYQQIYWSITGTTTSADLNGAALTGTSSVGSLTGDTLISGLSRRRQLNFTIKLDGIADGTKTLGFIARTGSQSGPIVASYENINVYDISTTPIYSISVLTQATPGSATVSEGQSPYTNYIQFAITTAGVADNTSLYWNIEGTTGTITPADFTSPGETALNGSCMINSNGGSVYFYTAADLLTEGTEAFTFYLRTGSSNGPIVAQSYSNILDTSLTAVAPLSGTTYTLANGPPMTLNPTYSPSTVQFGINVALSPPATIGPTFTFDTGQYGYGVDLGPGIPGIYTVTTQSAMTAQISPYNFFYSGLTSSLPIRTGPSISVSPSITYSASGGGGSSGGTVANLAASSVYQQFLYIQFLSSTDATAFVNWGGSGTIIITTAQGDKMSYTGVSAIPYSPPAPPGYVQITYSGTPNPAGLGSPGMYATVTY